ncbi:MAG: 4-(cytidine 5'-diphospho)-2-C-methyl-D-erythritol kinase [Eubacterium sp.]|nr:4-(cytidine 5'-diphospho)-2-C-methyl-D-erythritol kinase [Eubacterium sp.]
MLKLAYAKINLSLDIVGRREDGYHLVRMLMQTLDIADQIRLSKLEDNEIIITVSDQRGNMGAKDDISVVPVGQDNLIYKAAYAVLEKYYWNKKKCGGVKIELEKHIPVAAGLAGGSSDAAAVMKGINELFELGVIDQDLMKLGVKLGADIPYCIMGGTALSEGIGEELTRLPEIENQIVLVAKPPISVSTAEAYGGYDSLVESGAWIDHPDVDGQVDAVYGGNICKIASYCKNVLEQVTAANHMEIGQLEEVMKKYGAINSIMSGSGPTVFGIFPDMEKAEEASKYIKENAMAEQIFIAKTVSRN